MTLDGLTVKLLIRSSLCGVLAFFCASEAAFGYAEHNPYKSKGGWTPDADSTSPHHQTSVNRPAATCSAILAARESTLTTPGKPVNLGPDLPGYHFSDCWIQVAWLLLKQMNHKSMETVITDLGDRWLVKLFLTNQRGIHSNRHIVGEPRFFEVPKSEVPVAWQAIYAAIKKAHHRSGLMFDPASALAMFSGETWQSKEVLIDRPVSIQDLKSAVSIGFRQSITDFKQLKNLRPKHAYALLSINPDGKFAIKDPSSTAVHLIEGTLLLPHIEGYITRVRSY